MAERGIKMVKTTRLESDSIGTLEVPANAYYGVQSLRAKQNFPITGTKMNAAFIKNLAIIKKAAALTNCNSGKLENTKAQAIVTACDEVIAHKFDSQFIVDAIQGGVGTSANMNMNEVVANRANEILGGKLGAYNYVHPNDHVNMSQSTNDVIPTAGKLTVLDLLKSLIKEYKILTSSLLKKSEEFDDVIKMGRTQLQDAVPMRLGQTFHSYASMAHRDLKRLEAVRKEMYTINLGATAIGSSINVSEFYLDSITSCLGNLTKYPLSQADDLFDATENLDCFVTVSSVIKTCALDLSKMCNDLRLLSSGPKTGLGEINLPAKQNGSSIMPGKVNPVIPEVVNQVAFNIAGNDATIAMAAEAGQMELNAFEPVVFFNIFESIETLTSAIDTLVNNCINGITANKEHCKELMESSAGIATALCPYLGYVKSAKLAKESLKTGIRVRDLVIKENLLSEKELDTILDPYALTSPSRTDSLAM